MSDPRDESRDATSEDERFARAISDHYAPEPPTAARERAFDAALRERLEEPTRASVWRPALATALVCAAIGWLLLPPTQPPSSGEANALAIEVEPTPGVVALADLVAEGDFVDADAAGAADPDWEAELFGASDSADGGVEDEFLPDDYLAIRVWLDG